MICKLPGISIYFEASAVNTATPILFLHSALGSSDEMRPIRALFPERSVILLDLPGHGKTTEEFGSMTASSVAEIIVQFLERLRIPKVDIIGYSLGGYIGLELAVSHSSRVQSVITHAMKFYWTPEAIESAVSTFSKAPVAERTLRMTESLIRDFSQKQLHGEDIRNSKIPLLITTGERDEFVTSAEVTRLWEEIGGRNASFAIFPNAGHSLRKLPLDVFAQTGREFWRSII